MANLSTNYSEAMARGFTRRAVIYTGAAELLCLINPADDHDAKFTAYDIHENEFIWVAGWLIDEMDVAPESEWQPQTAADVIAYLTLTNEQGV